MFQTNCKKCATVILQITTRNYSIKVQFKQCILSATTKFRHNTVPRDGLAFLVPGHQRPKWWPISFWYCHWTEVLRKGFHRNTIVEWPPINKKAKVIHWSKQNHPEEAFHIILLHVADLFTIIHSRANFLYINKYVAKCYIFLTHKCVLHKNWVLLNNVVLEKVTCALSSKMKLSMPSLIWTNPSLPFLNISMTKDDYAG